MATGTVAADASRWPVLPGTIRPTRERCDEPSTTVAAFSSRASRRRPAAGQRWTTTLISRAVHVAGSRGCRRRSSRRSRGRMIRGRGDSGPFPYGWTYAMSSRAPPASPRTRPNERVSRDRFGPGRVPPETCWSAHRPRIDARLSGSCVSVGPVTDFRQTMTAGSHQSRVTPHRVEAPEAALSPPRKSVLAPTLAIAICRRGDVRAHWGRGRMVDRGSRVDPHGGEQPRTGGSSPCRRMVRHTRLRPPHVLVEWGSSLCAVQGRRSVGGGRSPRYPQPR
jgi:hypothetical protein